MCRWDAAFTEMSQGLACRAMRVIYHEVTSVSSRSVVLIRIECVRKALHTLVLHHPRLLEVAATLSAMRVSQSLEHVALV